MIIALTGKMHSGKSTVANHLLELLPNSKLLKFAQPLYDMQAYIYERARLEPPVIKDRRLLQWLGTDWGRTKSESIWTTIWELDAKTELMFGPTQHVICDDLRFDNEAVKVAGMGGFVVSIEADISALSLRGEQINTGHASESGIYPEFIKYRINNSGSKVALQRAVEDLLEILQDENDKRNH
jgi:hypothetical protein